MTRNPVSLQRPPNHPKKRDTMPIFNAHTLATAPTIFCIFLSTVLMFWSGGATPASRSDQDWTRAIVKIEVPIVRRIEGYARHFLERCSATVVSPGPKPLLISAWHCFDGHEALGSPATLLTDSGPIALELLASGGSMQQDWAVLQATGAWVPHTWIPIAPVRAKQGSRISAAGFSRLSEADFNTTTNHVDRSLIIDPNCRVTAAGSPPLASSCVIRRGASGGAILGRTQGGGLRVFGIISAGDSETVSYFYPTDLISSRVRP